MYFILRQGIIGQQIQSRVYPCICMHTAQGQCVKPRGASPTCAAGIAPPPPRPSSHTCPHCLQPRCGPYSCIHKRQVRVINARLLLQQLQQPWMGPACPINRLHALPATLSELLRSGRWQCIYAAITCVIIRAAWAWLAAGAVRAGGSAGREGWRQPGRRNKAVHQLNAVFTCIQYAKPSKTVLSDCGNGICFACNGMHGAASHQQLGDQGRSCHQARDHLVHLIAVFLLCCFGK